MPYVGRTSNCSQLGIDAGGFTLVCSSDRLIQVMTRQQVDHSHVKNAEYSQPKQLITDKVK